MKNIILWAFFIAGFLSQVAWGAGQPALTKEQMAQCDQQVNGQAKSFFSKQQQDREAFSKANPLPVQKPQAGSPAHLSKAQIQAQRAARAVAMAALNKFGQKQMKDRAAFIQKMRQQRQDCISSHSGTNS